MRWTEQRNFEAVLDLLAQGKVDVKPLISHRFTIEEAASAYELVSTGKDPYVGIILTYGPDSQLAPDTGLGALKDVASVRATTINLEVKADKALAPFIPTIGFIGAGNFSGQVILPALKKTGARLKTIASSGGVSGTHLGKKFGFEASTTDTDQIFADPEINTVFITTRHNTHGTLVQQALASGKNVFVEKPLCLKFEELQQIKSALGENGGSGSPILMVGFNRRFAPQVQKVKSLLAGSQDHKAMIMTVNAGMIPPEHWTQDPEVGGGRIIGEACHFIDLLLFLAGQPIKAVTLNPLKKTGPQDIVTFTLSFADGSIGTIHYFANGSKGFPKERLEVFCAGRILQLDNFIKLRGFGWPDFKKMNIWRQDKGHNAEIKAFVEAVKTGAPSPIPFGEIEDVTRATFDIVSR